MIQKVLEFKHQSTGQWLDMLLLIEGDVFIIEYPTHRYNSICQVPRTAMMIVEEPKPLATRMSCISARGTVDF